MTSVSALAMKTRWVVLTARSCGSAVVLLLLLAALSAVVDGHRPEHARRTSSAADQRGIHDSRVVQDADHISEHLQELKDAINVSAMSHEELEFHYFKMHDFDNNTKLDGLEILKALTHLLPYEPDDEKKDDVRGKSAEEIAKQKREKELLYYADIVDTVLDDDDIDNDGYLTYPEYIIARRRAEAQEEQESDSRSSSSSQSSRPSDSHHH